MDKRERKPSGFYKKLATSSLDIRKQRERERSWKKDESFDIKVSLFIYFLRKNYFTVGYFHIPDVSMVPVSFCIGKES